MFMPCFLPEHVIAHATDTDCSGQRAKALAATASSRRMLEENALADLPRHLLLRFRNMRHERAEALLQHFGELDVKHAMLTDVLGLV
jgi:hypothetical protein